LQSAQVLDSPVPNKRNSKGVEVRFSSEDSFRSDLVDILALYQAVYVG
jgi:homocitrate synthase